MVSPKKESKSMKILKNLALPIAMALGVLAWPILSPLSFLIPYMIFLMLFFTFLKISPRDMHFSRLHLLLALIQITLAIGGFFAFRLLDPIVAEGVMICFICPAATASSVIIGMLGGNIAFGATYVLLTHMGVAVLGPLLSSSLSTAHADMPFCSSVIHILWGVLPLVMVPLLAAWIIRFTTPRTHARLLRIPQMAFWLWVASLAIIMAKTTGYVMAQGSDSIRLELLLALGGLLSCLLQFGLGKWLSKRYLKESITAGQALGQKNTSLAIWMSLTYLNPIASIAPASYVVWQNSLNSIQIWLYDKRKNKTDRQ